MSSDKLRAAYIQWLPRKKWNFFLTIKFNTTSSLEAARTNFKRLCQALDRKLIGPKYGRRNRRRTLIVVASEHIHSNFHFHGMLKLCCKRRPKRRRLEKLLDKLWKRILPSGSVDLQRLCDAKGAAGYMTKELFVPEGMDRLLWSSEFWHHEDCKEKKRRRSKDDDRSKKDRHSRSHRRR